MTKTRDKFMKRMSFGEDYINGTKQYGKTDVWFAVIVYISLFISLFIISFIGTYFSMQENDDDVFTVIMHLILWIIVIINITLVFLLVRLRKQKISSLGFNKKNTLKSIVAGTILSMIVFIFMFFVMGQNQISDWLNREISSVIYSLIVLVVCVSLLEELIFRTYIGSRFYGVFDNKIASVFIVGILFSAMHYVPFLPGLMAGTIRFSDISINMVGHLGGHFILHWLYAKYNNIYGPILLHTGINLIGRIIV
jgi:membrane protease YdiL (CAAX protease family)